LLETAQNNFERPRYKGVTSVAKKGNWNNLDHKQKLQLLKASAPADIAATYLPPGVSKDKFLNQLNEEKEFWNPDNIENIGIIDRVPSKDITIGATRDLTRVEALLELIDNSIDAWMRRRRLYPNKTARELQIYIDVDVASKVLTYEDNAGGIPKEKLTNLVIPGFSDTKADEATIGSYRTGGKKAIFRLAADANIRTWYWNHAETSDEGYEVHLDETWLQSPEEYKFPYAQLKSKIDIERGQTIYKLRLKDEAYGGAEPWFEDDTVLKQMTHDIRRTYTLFLVRYPELRIYFIGNRKDHLKPIESLYKFSGCLEKQNKIVTSDIRPQRVYFEWKTEVEGKPTRLNVEIVLGARTTVAQRHEEDTAGIDLYGNDRLFVLQDTEFVPEMISVQSNVRNYIRGFINIHGSNSVIPWDTHKRHLNPEREVLAFLKKNRQVKEFFRRWKEVYSALSTNKALREKARSAIMPWSSEEKKDLNIPHSSKIVITKKKATSLPDDVHKPVIPQNSSKDENPLIKVEMQFTQEEFRDCYFGFEEK
jgi:hypothetical protein